MAGGLLAGCTPSAHSDDAATAGATSNAPDSWDYETDVVVVGGGGMGMAAATEARAGGASVVLLEKTGKLGGDAMSDGVVLGSGSKVLRILSGAENSEREPMLEQFANENDMRIEMTYQGSLDIMRQLEQDKLPYDAVWPASSLWLNLSLIHI